MREQQWRTDLGRDLAQVLVVPRRMRALVDDGLGPLTVAVPPDAEAIPVRRDPLGGVQALLDDGVLWPEEQIVSGDRVTRVRHPPAHLDHALSTANLQPPS